MTAGSQFANALLMGSTAPEFRGRFALDPYDLKPADNLTPDQQAAVDHYSAGSLYLNGDSPEAEGLRRHLDAAVDASRLSDNARLYRGASIPEEQLAALQPGSVVPLSPGYVSTSTAKEIAQRFHEDVLPGEAAVLMELRVPRGHPALHIPTDPTAEAELGGPQHEVLLPRGMQFRIHSTTERRDGLYHVLAEPVSP
jgi:hypothetical protein